MLPYFRKCIINTFSIDYHLWKASPRSLEIFSTFANGKKEAVYLRNMYNIKKRRKHSLFRKIFTEQSR